MFCFTLLLFIDALLAYGELFGYVVARFSFLIWDSAETRFLALGVGNLDFGIGDTA